VTRPIGSRYELGAQLGRGAFGSVWRGSVRETGEQVAIKVLLESLASDADVVTRFLRERKALISLRHDSIVAVRDLVVEGDLVAMVMQLVEGPDLKRYLATCGTVKPEEAALLVATVADALAVAHAAGIVHRDVKPGNVLLDETDGGLRPLLSDFGIAWLADVPALTRTHQVVGTPYYLSPEVISGRRPSPAMDIYAAGVMLYELCAGRQPFRGPDAMAVFDAHLRGEAEQPEGMPDELWRVLASCLAKQPEDRPDATTLARRLRVAVGVATDDEDGAGDAAADGAGDAAADGAVADPTAVTVPVRIDAERMTVLLPRIDGIPPAPGAGGADLLPASIAAAEDERLGARIPAPGLPPALPPAAVRVALPPGTSPSGTLIEGEPGPTRTNRAAQVTELLSPATQPGPVPGWDAPPTRGAYSGYRPREQQVAAPPPARTRPTGYPPQPVYQQAPGYPAPVAYHEPVRQQPLPVGYFAPQEPPNHAPAPYQQPSPYQEPPPSRRRGAGQDAMPRQPQQRPATGRPRRPRVRGMGCLFKLVLLSALAFGVAFGVVYLVTRIDSSFHHWVGGLHKDFHHWLVKISGNRIR
jgi:serine/threonine-protein kinase